MTTRWPVDPFSLWDQAGTCDPHMHELEGAGLLRQMSPDDAWQVDQDQFACALLRLLGAQAVSRDDPGEQEPAAERAGAEGLSRT
jgi:hypothetical protein